MYLNTLGFNIRFAFDVQEARGQLEEDLRSNWSNHMVLILKVFTLVTVKLLSENTPHEVSVSSLRGLSLSLKNKI